MYTTINNLDACCYMRFKALYVNNLTIIGCLYLKLEKPVNAHFTDK